MARVPASAGTKPAAVCGNIVTSYRWTTHRTYDGASDRVDEAAFSMWWLARAAAEETLQGSPLAASWLKLFRTHLSENDTYWLRWRGNFAESAELRRAYSGLYGRFFARAMLANHLGFSNFISLKRNGVQVGTGPVRVERSSKGDIPDWIAWNDASSCYVLCEAKGSLTSKDFLYPGGPTCAHDGKRQFSRVETFNGTTRIYPAQWVAATRWATDDRGGYPVTLLWDPPVDETNFGEDEATIHRTAITRAWLDSIAPALGWTGADDLISEERSKTALTIKADPGPIPESEDWPLGEEKTKLTEISSPTAPKGVEARQTVRELVYRTRGPTDQFGLPVDYRQLVPSPIYPDRQRLDPPPSQKNTHKGAYISVVITPFGIAPIRSQSDLESLIRLQERARNLEQPAMLVGLPLGLDPSRKKDQTTWLDGAGISSPDGLGVFDLRRIDVQPLEGFKS